MVFLREYFDPSLDLLVREYLEDGQVIRYGAFPRGWFKL